MIVDERVLAADPDDDEAMVRCTVRITDLTLAARIGVYHHECRGTQPLIVNVEAQIAVPRHDRLDETLDYDRIAGFARGLASEQIGLVETFALRLAEHCLAQPGVGEVDVVVRKPAAMCDALPGARITMRKRAGWMRQIGNGTT